MCNSLQTFQSAWSNKSGNVGITSHRDAFTKTLSPWKRSNYYTFLCVCACVDECVRVRVDGWVDGSRRVLARV